MKERCSQNMYILAKRLVQSSGFLVLTVLYIVGKQSCDTIPVKCVVKISWDPFCHGPTEITPVEVLSEEEINLSSHSFPPVHVGQQNNISNRKSGRLRGLEI